MTDVMYQQLGAVGVVLIAAGALITSLLKQLSAAQERRVTDAQQTTGKILGLVEKHNENQADFTAALNANTDALRALEQRMYQTRQ